MKGVYNEEITQEKVSTETLRGIVKFFVEDKGWGFITGESGKDYFVHIKAVIGMPIKKDDIVTFQTEEDDRGRGVKAVNVKLEKY